jgi:hypothetical protein
MSAPGLLDRSLGLWEESMVHSRIALFSRDCWAGSQHTCDVISVAAEFMVDVAGLEASIHVASRMPFE